MFGTLDVLVQMKSMQVSTWSFWIPPWDSSSSSQVLPDGDPGDVGEDAHAGGGGAEPSCALLGAVHQELGHDAQAGHQNLRDWRERRTIEGNVIIDRYISHKIMANSQSSARGTQKVCPKVIISSPWFALGRLLVRQYLVGYTGSYSRGDKKKGHTVSL